MLSAGVRAKLAALLYDDGFTGLARLLAEGTTDVFELGARDDGWTDTVMEAIEVARRSGRAQLVLVTPDGGGVWKVPELVGTVADYGPLGQPNDRLDAAIAEHRDPVIRRAPTPEEVAAAQDGTGPGIRMVYGRDGEDGWSFEFRAAGQVHRAGADVGRGLMNRGR